LAEGVDWYFYVADRDTSPAEVYQAETWMRMTRQLTAEAVPA
jgi:hypothetical protein